MAVSFTPSNRRKDNYNIEILVFFKGKRYKKTTGISLPAKYWNNTSSKCSDSLEFPIGKELNKTLKRQRNAAENACEFFKKQNRVPSKREFFDKMDFFMTGVAADRSVLVAYMDEYISNREKTVAFSSIKTYRSAKKIIEQYQESEKFVFTFADLNQSFYLGLRDFMYSGGNRGEAYSSNYFGRIIKFIRFVYNDARRNGVHSLPELANFKVEDHTADTIYLTVDELQKIFDLELTGTENLVRAKFLLGAYTGLRVSDYNNLDLLDIKDSYITLTTKKTGKKVIAPINSKVREIINTVDISKKISDQKINVHIKEIAKKAGINDLVRINKYIAGRRDVETHEKWELVSSHTARRSFATNAYKAGVPTISIMKITGHTTEKSFLRYIKISEEENAELMLKHEFFQ